MPKSHRNSKKWQRTTDFHCRHAPCLARLNFLVCISAANHMSLRSLHNCCTTLPCFIAASDSVWTQPHFLTSNLCWHNTLESLLTPEQAHHLSLSPLEWSRKDARAAATSLPLCPVHFKHMESQSDACILGLKKKKKVLVLNLYRLKKNARNSELLSRDKLGNSWCFITWKLKFLRETCLTPKKGASRPAFTLPRHQHLPLDRNVEACLPATLSTCHSSTPES